MIKKIKRPTADHLSAIDRAMQALKLVVLSKYAHTDTKIQAVNDCFYLADVSLMCRDIKDGQSLFE